ncbi:hypothetical protein GQX74_013492 [Glossina fuscipes]|nr:hypothetical protein GQX74_013492 [Glossina fuscipes]
MLEMINCGLVAYCGLPLRPTVLEFKRVCLALKDFENPHKPILFMISLVHERLKLSAFERDLAFFITQQREKIVSLAQKKVFKFFVTLKTLTFSTVYKRASYDNLRPWEVPPFPVTGNILKDRGSIPTRKIGLVLAQLKLI